MDALGIEWSLLIAQLVNFALLIVLLRMFLYQPILNMLAARKERIVQSMKDAECVSAAAREAEAGRSDQTKFWSRLSSAGTILRERISVKGRERRKEHTSVWSRGFSGNFDQSPPARRVSGRRAREFGRRLATPSEKQNCSRPKTPCSKRPGGARPPWPAGPAGVRAIGCSAVACR